LSDATAALSAAAAASPAQANSRIWPDGAEGRWMEQTVRSCCAASAAPASPPLGEKGAGEEEEE